MCIERDGPFKSKNWPRLRPTECHTRSQSKLLKLSSLNPNSKRTDKTYWKERQLLKMLKKEKVKSTQLKQLKSEILDWNGLESNLYHFYMDKLLFINRIFNIYIYDILLKLYANIFKEKKPCIILLIFINNVNYKFKE